MHSGLADVSTQATTSEAEAQRAEGGSDGSQVIQPVSREGAASLAPAEGFHQQRLLVSDHAGPPACGELRPGGGDGPHVLREPRSRASVNRLSQSRGRHQAELRDSGTKGSAHPSALSHRWNTCRLEQHDAPPGNIFSNRNIVMSSIVIYFAKTKCESAHYDG